MNCKVFHYPYVIKETAMDLYGHMNNAAYLTLLEEARWDFITQNGYGLKKIRETGLGPVMLEITIKYSRELQARDEVVIESRMISYIKKILKMEQIIRRREEVCCTAEFTIGLFNLKERKLVLPTPEWLNAIGITGL